MPLLNDLANELLDVFGCFCVVLVCLPVFVAALAGVFVAAFAGVSADEDFVLRALFFLIAAISVVTLIGYDWPVPWFFNGSTLHMLVVMGVMVFSLYTIRLAHKQRGIWGYSYQRWVVGAIVSTIVFFAWIQWFTTSTHWQCPPYWVGNDCPDESRLAVLHPTIRAAFPVGWWSFCLFALSLGHWRDLRVELGQWWLTLLSLSALLLLGWVVG